VPARQAEIALDRAIRVGYTAVMDPTPMHGETVPGGTHRQPDLAEEVAADDLDLTPDRDEVEEPGAMDNRAIIERSDLAIHLVPSVFPASRESVIEAAREHAAPPELLDRLARLPAGTYHTVQEVWTALGGPVESRHPAETFEPEAAPVEHPPLVYRFIDCVAVGAGRVTEVTVRAVLGVGVGLVRVTTRNLRVRRR
jgi:hypothetical protein